MGFKKKNKVSAEFSMSSLTDIIFLLLIFFMHLGLWSQEQLHIDNDKIDEVVNNIMKEGDIPGLSLIIVSP